MLAGFDGWETVQHPVNLVDPHYLSFIENVLPKVRAKGLGLLAMKCNAMGGIGKNKIATYAECLRFTLSQDVDTVVSGATTVEELEQNVATVKAFHKMTPEGAVGAADADEEGARRARRVENYKKARDRRRAARASRRRPRLTMQRRAFLVAAGAAMAQTPAFPIIDTHIHLFDPTRPQGVPWPPPSSTIYKPALPGTLTSG